MWTFLNVLAFHCSNSSLWIVIATSQNFNKVLACHDFDWHRTRNSFFWISLSSFPDGPLPWRSFLRHEKQFLAALVCCGCFLRSTCESGPSFFCGRTPGRQVVKREQLVVTVLYSCKNRGAPTVLQARHTAFQLCYSPDRCALYRRAFVCSVISTIGLRSCPRLSSNIQPLEVWYRITPEEFTTHFPSLNSSTILMNHPQAIIEHE